MIRLNTDGSMDETWGTGGEVVAGLGRLRDLEIQPDGKILVLGRSISDPSFIQIQRFQESGLVDTDYGIDGSSEVYYSTTSSYGGIHLLPDGKVLVLENGLIFRLDYNGTIDTTFANTGYFTAPTN